MAKELLERIQELLEQESTTDTLIVDSLRSDYDASTFVDLTSERLSCNPHSVLCSIDGGQAEIFNSGNFSVTFIRVAAVSFEGIKKKCLERHEFYVLTRVVPQAEKLLYVSELFVVSGELLIQESLLTIDSMDASIRSGSNRAPIEKVAIMARRFAELELARRCAVQDTVDLVLVDGTLSATFTGEQEFLARLGPKVCGLAKTSSLLTALGNNPTLFLQQQRPKGIWAYPLNSTHHFVKLHDLAKHVFRFEGTISQAALLVALSSDPLFLGYPYSLILVDRLARVSNAEKKQLQVRFLATLNTQKAFDFLGARNAHDILDSMG